MLFSYSNDLTMSASSTNLMLVNQARDNLKKAEAVMAAHKRNAHGGGAEWRGNWDNGHWYGHNSADLNRIYTNLYIKIQQAIEKLEQALDKADPYRKDLDKIILNLINRRKNSSCSDIKFDPLLDRLVMIICRQRIENSDHDAETLYSCKHYFQGRKVPCDCVADDIGFLTLSPDNEERLAHKRLCFIGDHNSWSGANWGKPVRGPIKAGKADLYIHRIWVKKDKQLVQECQHYFMPRWNSEKEYVPCDCIRDKLNKQPGFLKLNPDNIWIKNCYYRLNERAPITISRHYSVSGIDHCGSDTFKTTCIHIISIEGCNPGDFSDCCDCYANGELSEKMKKFDTKGLIEKQFTGNKLNAMSKITITRETRGLIPHPAGHNCRHIREDGGTMDCDCIPLFRNKESLTDKAYDEVLYELSDDMKKRHEVGRVVLVKEGKIVIGGFFKHVFMSSCASEERKPTPYDDDKYVVYI